MTDLQCCAFRSLFILCVIIDVNVKTWLLAFKTLIQSELIRAIHIWSWLACLKALPSLKTWSRRQIPPPCLEQHFGDSSPGMSQADRGPLLRWAGAAAVRWASLRWRPHVPFTPVSPSWLFLSCLVYVCLKFFKSPVEQCGVPVYKQNEITYTTPHAFS